MDGKRITLKRARPNPLFQDWLEELHEEAEQKKSKLEPMLKEALNSLSKYPLPLKSGAECNILQGFEKKLCMYLDQRLEVYNDNMRAVAQDEVNNQSNTNGDTDSQATSSQNNGNSIEPTSSTSDGTGVTRTSSLTSSNSENIQSDQNCQTSTSNTKKNKSKMSKMYKPANGSGSYAILVTLLEQSLENPSKVWLTKEELIEKAQKHAQESFTRPKPGTFYTAWSNMNKLVKRDLIKKTRSKTWEYSLTDTGLQVARELLENSKTIPTINDIIFNSGEPRGIIERDIDLSSDEEPCRPPIFLPAGYFDVILLIDKNETGGVTNKNDPTVAQFNKFPDLKHEYRSLKVGDFTWIARHRANKKELVLPYIVERKRMDDLAASIKDGRFHEQKFRLRKCGIDNIIYLVQNHGSNKNLGLPLQSLKQALANTQVQDGFKVHIADSLTDSVRYLAMMTKRLTLQYKDEGLLGRHEKSSDGLMSFEYFNQASSKTKALTVTETFIKLLLQLKGLTVEKALAITNSYKTPYALINAYEQCDQDECQMLLANLKYGEMSRNVGPAVSKAVYQLFINRG